MPNLIHLRRLHILIQLAQHGQPIRRMKAPPATQRQSRDRTLTAPCPPLQILRLVVLERPVQTEPAPHGARLRVVRGVHSHRLVQRGAVVRLAVEEEEANVVGLAAGQQRLGQVGHAVERQLEVVHARLALVVLARARHDALGVARGVGVRDHGAHVVADDVDLVRDAEDVVDEVEEVGGEGGLAEFVGEAGGLGGLGGAAVVRGDDAVARRREGLDDMAEVVGGVWEAVNEEEGALWLFRWQGGRRIDSECGDRPARGGRCCVTPRMSKDSERKP